MELMAWNLLPCYERVNEALPRNISTSIQGQTGDTFVWTSFMRCSEIVQQPYCEKK